MNAFLIGLQFLTRLKLVEQKEWNPNDFGASVTYFPFVGAVIGLALLGVYYGLLGLMPLSLLMLILVVFEFLFTGGLHADGFMDTCDGLFSGREREKKLEIMKDSRVGANGVVGFVFLTLLKWQLLASMPTSWVPLVLFAMPTLSRYTMVLSITQFPYARPEGIGKAFAQYAPTNCTRMATIFALLFTFYWGWSYAILFTVMVGLAYVLNSYITKHLGGTTGDTYGFVCEVSEVLLLFFVIVGANYI